VQTPNIEYIPNNTYPYCDVKKTIGQKYPHVKVRPSRFWNETPAKDIADELLYSLSDYWPGMPIQTDIVVDNYSLGLHVYKTLEARCSPPDMITSKRAVDATATIQRLVELRAMPDASDTSLEDYLMKTESMESKYALYLRAQLAIPCGAVNAANANIPLEDHQDCFNTKSCPTIR
jgi:hypothetical protein